MHVLTFKKCNVRQYEELQVCCVLCYVFNVHDTATAVNCVEVVIHGTDELRGASVFTIVHF